MSKKIISAVIAAILLGTSQSILTPVDVNAVTLNNNESVTSGSISTVDPLSPTSEKLPVLIANLRVDDNPKIHPKITVDAFLNGSTAQSTSQPVVEDNISKPDDTSSSVKSPSVLNNPSSNNSQKPSFVNGKAPLIIDDSNLISLNLKPIIIDDKLVQHPINTPKPYIPIKPTPPILVKPSIPNWSYLVGINGDCASKVIKNQRPELKVFIMKPGAIQTKDIRFDRVRVYVDKNNNVIRTPVIG